MANMTLADFFAAPMRSRDAADRGSADAYYWRMPRPHFYDEQGNRVTVLTEAETAAYMTAYDNETDRKSWD